MGKNLVFLDLHDSEFRVQVKAHKNNYKGDFSDAVSKLANGDVIGNWFFDHSSAKSYGNLGCQVFKEGIQNQLDF